MREIIKKMKVATMVNLNVTFSIPLRVWNVSPPPPQALPKPPPFPCIRIKTVIIIATIIFKLSKIFFIN